MKVEESQSKVCSCALAALWFFGLGTKHMVNGDIGKWGSQASHPTRGGGFMLSQWGEGT